MILVTGGTGLVGAHLLYELTKRGEKVRAIFRSEEKIEKTRQVFATYGNGSLALLNKIEWVKADILDIPALSKAFNGITHVYHCAAFVSFEPDKYHKLRRINIEGTANVVNISIDKNISKLCYVSSIATLGEPIKTEIITETTFWNPEDDNSVYSITKYGAEMEVWRGSQEGLDVVIVNPGLIFGAGIWHYGSGSIFKKAFNGIKYYTSGTTGIIAVEDVVCIMIELMHVNIRNERYILIAENWSYENLLTQLSVSVNRDAPKKTAPQILLELAWRLDWLKHKLFGKKRRITRHLVKSLQSQKTYSNNKISKLLNYSFKPIDKTILNLGSLYLKQAE